MSAKSPWSDKPPAEPGFWWWRGDVHLPPTVVCVGYQRGRLRAWCPGNRSSFDPIIQGGQWGPRVPEPHEGGR